MELGEILGAVVVAVEAQAVVAHAAVVALGRLEMNIFFKKISKNIF